MKKRIEAGTDLVEISFNYPLIWKFIIGLPILGLVMLYVYARRFFTR